MVADTQAQFHFFTFLHEVTFSHGHTRHVLLDGSLAVLTVVCEPWWLSCGCSRFLYLCVHLNVFPEEGTLCVRWDLFSEVGGAVTSRYGR